MLCQRVQLFAVLFAFSVGSSSGRISSGFFNDLMPTPHGSSSSVNSMSMDMPGAMAVGGVFPSLAVTADSGPTRTECGIGALMPWANNLYMVTYLSTPSGGDGTGLYVINSTMHMKKLVNHTSTFANRLLHPHSNQIIIGAWAIDMEGNVKAFSQLVHVRIGGMAMHLKYPETMVYMLGMDGPLWECNVIAMNCTQIFDLVAELNIPTKEGEQVHFKAAHTMNGRLVVASNTEEEADFLGSEHGGRLAEWTGEGEWKILEEKAFVEVAGRGNFGRVIYAVGWDAISVILKVFVGQDGTGDAGVWTTYRLPKASHAYDHLWQTEWPRIREVETERYLLDMHGQFYELSPLGWAGSTWGLRPVSRHLRMIPDFTSFRGFLVLGGNQVSSIRDNNLVTGQAQSGLWFGKTDDLWSFGKPQGWGGVWRKTSVTAGTSSDPFLMTGFDKKVLHITAHPQGQEQEIDVRIQVQVDFLGTAGHISGEGWNVLTTIEVRGNPQDGPVYEYFVFADAFSAHWVRLYAVDAGILTAYFHYT